MTAAATLFSRGDSVRLCPDTSTLPRTVPVRPSDLCFARGKTLSPTGVPRSDLRWEAPRCSDTSRCATVSANGLTVRNSGNGCVSVIARPGMSSGVHRWAISLDRKGPIRGRDVYIGICTSENYKADFILPTFGYCIDRLGKLQSPGVLSAEDLPGDLSLGERDKLHVRLDCDRGVLAFGKEGSPFTIAFAHLPNQTWFACASMYSTDDTLSIISPLGAEVPGPSDGGYLAYAAATPSTTVLPDWPLQWDTTDMSGTSALVKGADSTTIENTSDTRFTAVARQGWETGLHSWKATIVQEGDPDGTGRDIYVGVTSRDALDRDGTLADFGFCIDRFCTLETPHNRRSSPGMRLRPDSVISFTLNCDNHTLDIEVVGAHWTMTRLPSTLIYPAVTLYRRGDSVRLLPESASMSQAPPRPAAVPMCPVAGCGRPCSARPGGGYFTGCSAAHSRVSDFAPRCPVAGCTKRCTPNPSGGYHAGCCPPHSIKAIASRGGAAPRCCHPGCPNPAAAAGQGCWHPGCSLAHSREIPQLLGQVPPCQVQPTQTDADGSPGKAIPQAVEAKNRTQCPVCGEWARELPDSTPDDPLYDEGCNDEHTKIAHSKLLAGKEPTHPANLRMSLFCRPVHPSEAHVQVSTNERNQLFFLTNAQLRAIHHVTVTAAEMSDAKRDHLIQRVRALGFSESKCRRLLQYVRSESPLIIHFNAPSFLARFLASTHYKNQFETGTSGGSKNLTHRKMWEMRCFNGAYADDCPAAERPKYGVLNLTKDPCGVRSCVQYGRSYLELRNVRLRATFANMDTSDPRVALATCENYIHILDTFSDPELRVVMEVATGVRSSADTAGAFQQYKEVQLHGDIVLARDVARLVINLDETARTGDRTPSREEMRRMALEFGQRNHCTVTFVNTAGQLV